MEKTPVTNVTYDEVIEKYHIKNDVMCSLLLCHSSELPDRRDILFSKLKIEVCEYIEFSRLEKPAFGACINVVLEDTYYYCTSFETIASHPDGKLIKINMQFSKHMTPVSIQMVKMIEKIKKSLS